MAIKVNGTTAVSDSRQLENITSIDETTAASINAAGVGGGPSVEATASGALANGDLVLINSDGTVSVVEETPISQATGSPTLFNSGGTGSSSASFDSNSNKVVIAYKDTGNGGYGTCVVGTVSGTSISFGSEVIFNSGNTDSPSVTFDSTNNKIVVAFQDVNFGQRYGKVRVGTVSGTSISFGSVTTFESASTSSISSTYDVANAKVVIAYRDNGNSGYGKATVGTVSGSSISFGSVTTFESTSTSSISTAFDSNSNKVVIAYSDTGNSSYGTAVVGTVDGTSIGFGDAVVFESASISYTSATFDSNSNKVVIAYQDGADPYPGTAIVGTVSGSSISFGSPTVFENAQTDYIAATFDSNSNKVVIAYKDSGNSNYGTLVVGTLSGDSISFGSPVVFESANTYLPSATYDSNSKVVVVPYADLGNSDRGTAVVFRNASSLINLTSDNFIGISDGAYSNGATATVQPFGAIDDAQSGLTAGQAYYVQTDGTLDTTPDDPSVFAGTAVSATKIIVKG